MSIASALLLLATVLAPVASPLSSVAEATGVPACGTTGTPTVTAAHNPNFYIDSSHNSLLFSQYAGYQVRAGGQGGEGLWVTLGDFTGDVVNLADGQTPTQALPNLASGSSTMAYFLLTADPAVAPGGTAVPQRHSITLYEGNPATGGSPVCTRAFTYTHVRETIKALANKVVSIGSSATDSSPATLGETVLITVEGNTGTLGAGPTGDPGVLDFTPNALGDFPAGAWRLERTELTISPDGSSPPVTYVDRLYLSGASGPNRPYTARYRFRAVGPTGSQARVMPIQYIASGTQVKHTDLGSTPLHLLPTVSSVADLHLSKDATPDTIDLGDDVVPHADYTITLSNAGGSPGIVDEVVDTLPAGATYVDGTARLDGGWIAEPTLVGDSLVFRGPLTVPASGHSEITYTLDLGSGAGARTNSAVAHYVQNVIDASPDVLHSEPASAVVRLRVAGLDGPEAVPDHVATPANTPVAVDVLGNDTSPTDLTLQVESFDQPSGSAGSVARSGDQLVFTPAAAFAGRTTFTYTVTDGTLTDTGIVTVDVAPRANDDSFGGPPTTALRSYPSVLANDTCPDCTASVETPPASGTLALRPDGTFDYTPPNTSSTTVTFTYRATLPTPSGPALTVDSDTGTVTITLAEVAPDFATTAHASPVSLDVIDNDNCTNCNVQNSVPTGGAPTNGTVGLRTPNNRSVTYTPYATIGNTPGGQAFWGIDRFLYGTTAGAGAGQVTILVAPPNRTMTATSGGTPATLDLATGVCAGCTLEFSVGAAPDQGTVAITTNGEVTYTPPSGWAGVETLSYTVREPVSGLSVTGTVTVTVGPQAVDDHVSVTHGAQVVGNVLDNDVCDGSCTVSLVDPPSGGDLVLGSDGAFTYTATGVIGTVTFTYRITDTEAPGIESTATVTVEVGGTADVHTSTPFGTPITIDVAANDPCTSCTISDLTSPAAGSVALNGDGTVTYTPPDSFSGRAVFTYTVSLGGGTATATVTVDVAPRAVDDETSTLAGHDVVVFPLVNDLCSNCSVETLGSPTNGSASIRTDGRTVLYSPDPGYTGADAFTYTLIDGNGSTDTATITVSVAAPPTLADDTATTTAGEPVAIDVLANDDCTGCELGVEADPTTGTVALLVDGSLLYVPEPGHSGFAVFSYRATDPATGAHGVASVTVTIAPTAADDQVRTAVGQPVVVEVLTNDACTGCTVTVSTGPESGSADVDGDQILYTPPPGFVGTDTFSYLATDPATGLSSGATVVVVVDDAAPDAAAIDHGETLSDLDVLANDTCTDCAVVSVTTTSAGVASFSGSTVGFQPAEGFWGLAQFDYVAEPTGGGTPVSSTVSVLVGPPPSEFTVALDTPLDGHLLDVGIGGECDEGCEFALVDPPAFGEIDLSPDGSFTFTPPDYSWTDDHLTYRVLHLDSGVSVDGLVTFVPAEPGALEVTKTLEIVDDSVVDPAGRLDAGDLLNYQISVTNTGGTAIGPITVADPLATDVSCPGADELTPSIIPSLDPSQTVDCTALVTLDQDMLDHGTVTNTATATTVISGQTHSASSGPVTETLAQEPSLSLLASVVAGPASLEACDTTATTLDIAPGDTVTWCFAVTNTGNVTLESISLVDETLGLGPDGTSADLLFGSTSLAPGAIARMSVTAAVEEHTISSTTARGDAPDETVIDTSAASTTITVTAPTTTTTTSTTAPPSTTSTTAPPSTTSTTSTTAPPSTTTTTSTTAPPSTTTTTSTTAPPSTTSTISGLVWFDRNSNGRLDAGEWPLPGVVVTLTALDTVPGGDGKVAGAWTTVTDQSGRYTFTGLFAGTYRVTAGTDLAGFTPTGNTRGGQSWTLELSLEPGATGDASYFGIGHGHLTGAVFDADTSAPTADAQVRCLWAGLDDTFGTDDDVEILLLADSAGRFDVRGVPYGEFRCTGSDPQTGRSSQAARAGVWSPEPAYAALPLSGSLPRTGAQLRMLSWATFMLLSGVAIVTTSRGAVRRESRASRT